MEYTIKSDTLSVTCKTTGGVLTSICDKDGGEYLWQGDPKYWPNQAPNLFPICGSIRGDEAKLANGKTTKMGRHGFIRPMEFTAEVVEADRVTLTLCDTPETLEMYPFAFKLSVTYRVSGKNLTVSYQVDNKSAEDMPFFLGGHPAFQWPLVKGEEKSDYVVTFEKEESCTVPTPVTSTGLIDVAHRTQILDHARELALTEDMFDVDAVIFDELTSGMFDYHSKKSGKGVRIDCSQFPYLVLWSSTNRGNFLATEPWLGLSTCSDESDLFEDKRNVQIAPKGSSRFYAYTISVH